MERLVHKMTSLTSSDVPLTFIHSLRKLKEKLRQQRAHLDELDKHISELESGKGGEQN